MAIHLTIDETLVEEARSGYSPIQLCIYFPLLSFFFRSFSWRK